MMREWRCWIGSRELRSWCEYSVGGARPAVALAGGTRRKPWKLDGIESRFFSKSMSTAREADAEFQVSRCHV